MKYVYSVLVLLLALFLAAFIQQNGTTIELRYFSWSTPHLPISLYMILSFAAGYALAVLVGLASGVRFRLRASGAEREVRKLRSELDQLKKEEIKSVLSGGEPDKGLEGAGPDEDAGEGRRDLTGMDLEPDAPTVITGPGGEEEK